MGLYKLRTDFGHHFKWLLIAIAFGFFIGGIFYFSSYQGQQATQGGGASADQIATVGGMPVSRGEMEYAWSRQVEVLRDQGMRSSLQYATMRGQLFQSLLQERVTLAIAKALGVEISNSDVQRRLDDLVTMQLRDNRRAVMGTLSPERERSDPRSDSEYKDELRKNNLSLREIEDRIRAFTSEPRIQSELAQEAIRNKIIQNVGPISARDVTNSYNVYTIRQIAIAKSSLPPDQLRTRVDKIVAQAKAGGDFAALARQYSQGSNKGGTQSLSFDEVASGWMMVMRGGSQYMPLVSMSFALWDQVSNMKPGEVSAPMDTDQAVFIVKVESVTPKLPAKLDKKTQDERRRLIQAIRAWREGLRVEQDVRKKLVVNVTDPEFAGYWKLAQLGQSRDPVEIKKQRTAAKDDFERAIVQDPSNQFATAMLAVTLAQMGDTKQATVQLYHLLEGPSSKGEGSDLRILLGDLLLQSKRKDEALKQYAKASEAAGLDVSFHQQLIARFKQIGRPDLAAKEQQTAADLEAKQKLIEAERAKSGAVPQRSLPTPGGGP